MNKQLVVMIQVRSSGLALQDPNQIKKMKKSIAEKVTKLKRYTLHNILPCLASYKIQLLY